MSKYLIEGGIDFYSELYKSLDDNNNDADNDDENICLITNAPLMEKFVTLKCKHKFNYVPLFKDIMNRRTFKLFVWTSSSRNCLKRSPWNSTN